MPLIVILLIGVFVIVAEVAMLTDAYVAVSVCAIVIVLCLILLAFLWIREWRRIERMNK